MSRNRHLRALTQDDAFTGTRQPLRQIEKIVSGMFRRKTNFDDLQSMVIDCVSDESEWASMIDMKASAQMPKLLALETWIS